ncbi:hypothetical protein C8P63_13820 [Melghirimyces profundicolus]|uniref:Uncharacterized protein n=2 Tax=Melghirimyces profundicolus TaxID=1242148 RepID=A0A2T6B230_9BACL|nr:hypothetical protein C8P63_13820 [Melghirimyces profundicolus]
MRMLMDLKPGTFDLHIHTCASCIFSPSEVVEMAKHHRPPSLTTIHWQGWMKLSVSKP